jgi:hypothetical protein
MFDMLEPTGISDSISDALYKWRGIAGWPEAEAIVLACIWTPDAEIRGHCHYRVMFSYLAASGLQSGSFGINGTDGHSPYQTFDTFTLRYHPKRQSTFYYANEQSRLQGYTLILAAAILGLIGALLVIGIFPN